MNIPESLRYTKDHEWIRIEGSVGIIGITDHAQTELGDIVFIELPKIGQSVEKEKSLGTIEAVKSVSDIYAPAGGSIVEVNADLEQHSNLINEDPYGKGWIVKIQLSHPEDTKDLLDAAGYRSLIGQ